MVSDKELSERILSALLSNESLSAHPVEVSVAGGIATLRGSVQSHRRKLMAQEIAAAFEGCRGVINELVVSPPGRVSDDDVARHVRAAMEAHADITKETITVSVSNGVVTLNGSASSHWERTQAEDIALGSKGVGDVKNLLLVDLDEQIEEEALAREIRATLAQTRGLIDADIRVAVSGSTAVLSGEVPTLWQKETAESVALRFRVSHVRNEITVMND